MSNDYHINRIANELRAERAQFEAEKIETRAQLQCERQIFEKWRAEEKERFAAHHDLLLAKAVEASLGNRIRELDRREARLAKREARVAGLEDISAVASLIALRDRRLALRTWAHRR